jgi:hypothetical protein
MNKLLILKASGGFDPDPRLQIPRQLSEQSSSASRMLTRCLALPFGRFLPDGLQVDQPTLQAILFVLLLNEAELLRV